MEGVGRAVMLGSGATVIRLGIRKERYKFFSTLAHEIFHAVEFLFDRVGIKHDIDKSSEAYAYQIDYLTYQIYNKIK